MYKVIFLGEARVGKTCIINRYVHDTFNPNNESSMQIDSVQKPVDNLGTITIWDTLGQEQYKSLNRFYYKRTDACVIVVDVTQENFKNQLAYWLDEFINNCDQRSESMNKKSMSSSSGPNSSQSDGSDHRGNKTVISIFMNKIDRIEDSVLQAWQQEQEIKLSQWCDVKQKKYNLSRRVAINFVSAKTGEGIEEAFQQIAKGILLSQTEKQNQDLSRNIIDEQNDDLRQSVLGGDNQEQNVFTSRGDKINLSNSTKTNSKQKKSGCC